MFAHLFYFFGGSHVTPVLLYKFLQHVYSDSALARIYKMHKVVAIFIFCFGQLPILLRFIIHVFSYVFTGFIFI